MTGFATVLLLVGGLGGWAATSSLASCTRRRHGRGRQQCQESAASDRRRCRRDPSARRRQGGGGDLVMRLDEVIRAPTSASSPASSTNSQLGWPAPQGRARRLSLGRDTAGADRQAEADIAEIIAGERALFASRSTARAGRRRNSANASPSFAKKLVVSRRSNTRRPMNWSQSIVSWARLRSCGPKHLVPLEQAFKPCATPPASKASGAS
jgi:hypothetical protein